MNRFILSLFILLAGLPLAAEPIGTNVIEIQEQTNLDIWPTYHFAVSKDGKKLGPPVWGVFGGSNVVVEWKVIDRVENHQPRKFIFVWAGESFWTNAQIHRAIMKKVFSRWPVSDFEGIKFIGLDGAPDWSWEVAIAAASSKSADYQDYKTNYLHSKVTSLFSLYKQFVTDTKVYYPLRDAFREIGVDLKFESGEIIVLTSMAEDLPFYTKLKAMGINGRTTVIYGAMGNGFSIKPWPSTNSLAR